MSWGDQRWFVFEPKRDDPARRGGGPPGADWERFSDEVAAAAGMQQQQGGGSRGLSENDQAYYERIRRQVQEEIIAEAEDNAALWARGGANRNAVERKQYECPV